MFMTQWGGEGQHPKQVILNGPGMMGEQGDFRAGFFSFPFTSRYFRIGQSCFLTLQPTFLWVISVQQRLVFHKDGNAKNP